MFHHFNRSEELLREMVQIHENSIGFYDKIDKHLFNRSIESKDSNSIFSHKLDEDSLWGYLSGAEKEIIALRS